MGRSTCKPAGAPTCDGSATCDNTNTCQQPTCNATAPTCTNGNTCNGSGNNTCVSSSNTCQSNSSNTCSNNNTCNGSGTATCIGNATCDNAATCVYTSTCRGKSSNTCTNSGAGQAVACIITDCPTGPVASRGAGPDIPGSPRVRPASTAAGELVTLLRAMHCDGHWSHREPVVIASSSEPCQLHGGAPGVSAPCAHHGH